MLNRIDLMGRLTRDPELRHTSSGKPVAAFSIAVERDNKDQDGNRPVDFIEIVAWNQLAEVVSRYMTKGRMVVVSGRLQMRNWTDKNGNKRVSAEVVAESVYFADSKREDNAPANSSYSAPPAGNPYGGTAYGGVYDGSSYGGDNGGYGDDDYELPY